jgi:2-amino-4-hydroxy-6-hydroxymethyldihydropteridine diphosphokinase
MKALLSLGSNVGNRVANLANAVNHISKIGNIISISSLYETSPVGDVEQENFYNIACVIESSSQPHDLLLQLHSIESVLGRTREVHWGPRTIDIDIVDVEGFRSDTDELHVPHRHAHLRKFVLLPAAEIAPNWELAGEELHHRLSNLSSSEDVTRVKADKWFKPLIEVHS